MLVSFRWLQELCPVDADVAEVAHRISLAGLEVEAMDEKGKNLSGVVIAEVRAKSPHPKKDKLTLVTVFDGEDEHEVVCGAPNVPEPGGRVLFARSGAVLAERDGDRPSQGRRRRVQRDDLQRGRARDRRGRRRDLRRRLGQRCASGNRRRGRPRPSRRHSRHRPHAQSPRLPGPRRNRPRNRGSFRRRLHAPQGRRAAADLCCRRFVPVRRADQQAHTALGHRERDGRHPGAPRDLGRDRRWRSLPEVRRRARVGCQSRSIAILAPLPVAQSRPSRPVERRRCDQSDSARVGPSDSRLRPREAGRIQSRRSPRVRGREDGDPRWRRAYLHRRRPLDL